MATKAMSETGVAMAATAPGPVRRGYGRPQDPAEERLNALTHGAGLVVALVVGPLLWWRAFLTGDAAMIAAVTWYAVSLVGVFLSSTMSHAVADPDSKRRWEIRDQAFIYLLISGTFFPYAAAFLRDPRWLWLVALMAVGALAGFLSKTVFQHRIRGVSIPIYVLLGWATVPGVPAMVEQLPRMGVAWTATGALAYMLGTAFLAYDHRRRYLHVIWHLCVLAGAWFHLATIWRYALPTS
jgi:hemolysin III